MPELTLMAVHAHPDDEAITTGGVLARYSLEGVNTVLVTCTDGSLGDGPGGVKPGEPGHDIDVVVATRRAELERSCKTLGIHHLEVLGYPDSGMEGWPQNHAPGSFWSTPVSAGAEKLAALLQRYQPQVVITYDANGFYGHPDHIQAHRITMAAIEQTGIPRKLYFTAASRSWFAALGRSLRELGIDFPGGDVSASDAALPADDPEAPPQESGTPDEEITTTVDVSDVTDQKFDSLLAHSSQSDNIFFLQLGREAFGQLMTRESFIRVLDRTGAPLPEADLFAGIR